MSEAVLSVDSIKPFLHASKEDLRLDLYIKGVKCGHCVHKITKVLELHPMLQRFHFESGGKRLSLWSQQASSFGDLIEKINQLGFEAIPLEDATDESQANRDFKSQLKKLAVSGVCAGNIMLFSTAIYLGADEGFKSFFHTLSFALVVPVLGYSASSIWYGFWQSLKSRKFNLDFPIGLALLLGSVLSVLSYFHGLNSIYFDSLAVVVFLILSSRFVLNRYVANIYINNIVSYVPGVYQARIERDGQDHWVSLASLSIGDAVVVKRGETIPIDGTLLSSEAIIDGSVLTGEFSPVVLKEGALVFAGTRLCAGECRVRVLKKGAETRVGGYIQAAQKNHRQDQEESYRWVGYFTGFVILASALTFGVLLWTNDLSTAYQRAFAIVLVACPCAISFGIPLIRSFSGQLSLRNGLVLKQPNVLKKLGKIKNIFLDKTGTLTKAIVRVNRGDFMALQPEDRAKLLALELSMDHPISNGFKTFQEGDAKITVEDFQYHPGVGISGRICGEHWWVRGAAPLEDDDDSVKRLEVVKADRVITTLRLENGFKDDLSPFLLKLAEMGKKISVLSGDQKAEVEKIKELVPPQNRGDFVSEATPEEKNRFIQAAGPNSVMIGDGINDIAAMQSAGLSLCMPGALEDNMNVADVTLTRGHLSSVLDLFQISDKILLTERRLLTFTFFYNCLCVGLAAFGFISPVVAAILMPISSVTVLSLVTLSLRRL